MCSPHSWPMALGHHSWPQKASIVTLMLRIRDYNGFWGSLVVTNFHWSLVRTTQMLHFFHVWYFLWIFFFFKLTCLGTLFDLNLCFTYNVEWDFFVIFNHCISSFMCYYALCRYYADMQADYPDYYLRIRTLVRLYSKIQND